jgi:tRNA pseudouridine38-40 synthase
VTTWRLRLEYEGTRFAGWQVQPGQITVQSEVEAAVRQVFADDSIRVIASGRTDAGVHALGQVVCFRSEADRRPDKVCMGLNARLPEEIACLEAAISHPDFHAQRSAVGKLYRYVLRTGTTRSALERNRCWQIRYSLDLAAMKRALKSLEGRHDFSSFRAAGCASKSPVRTLHRAELLVQEEGVWLEFYGDGFLRHMVRNIVGSLHDVGRHKHPPEWFGELLAARNRMQAGITAPAAGLFLVRVDYPAALLVS